MDPNNLDEIVAALERMTPGERAALDAEATKIVGRQRWFPNPGPQSQAYYSKADVLLYGGEPGGGKALRINELVLTPTGWKEIGKLKVGDAVCATDSTVTEVIGVFPQGVRPLYRVTMRDGASVLADEEHTWLAWRTHANTKQANKVTTGVQAARKWTTRQLMTEMAKGPKADGRTRGFAIPVAQPVRFNVAGQLKGPGNFVPREIDPYLLGLILGDGCIQPKLVSVSTLDPYIQERIEQLAQNDVRTRQISDNGFVTCNFRGDFNRALLVALGRLGLTSAGAADKFIPRQYLFAPTEARWELLRGLMDTDGWAEEKRALYFTSISEQLAKDVAHLVMSLGCVASMTSRIPTFTYKGEKKDGQRAYTVRIKAPNPEECFGLPRKREVAATISHQSLSRVIEAIEYECDDEAVCIAVAHPNSLFITRDFIVTHNSQLLIGLALNCHKRTLLMRRKYSDLGRLVEDTLKAHGSRDGFNGSPPPRLRTPDGRAVDFGAAHRIGDEQDFMGRGRDFLGVDEATHFAESQIRFLMGWNRSEDPNQRVRTVLATNPPLDAEGLWVIQMFAPWLDPAFPHPALPAELRWVVSDEEGKDQWVDGPSEVEINGKMVRPMSRTYIPASVEDNPEYANSDYKRQLDALSEPWRSLLMGGFRTAFQDAKNQVIPTAWVLAAQKRWEKRPPNFAPMCAIGVDASGGGTDPMILARRHDGWFDEIIEVPGKEIPVETAGATAAGIVVSHRRDNALVVVDMGGGYGASMYEHLKRNNVSAKGHKGSAKALGKSRDGHMAFFNTRSAVIWRFREALDPGQPGGSVIALPPDQKLVADLTAPTLDLGFNGIKVESKEDVCKRLGRSTDRGDAVVMAWSSGLKSENVQGGDVSSYTVAKAPQVIMGRAAARRR